MTATTLDRATRRRPGGRVRAVIRRNERLLLSVLGVVVVLVAWEVAVNVGWLRRLFVSSPSEIAAAAAEAIADGSLWPDIRISLTTFVIGYVAAVIFGTIAGFVIGWYRRANYLFDPWVSALYATPDVALIPLIILWLGIGVWTNAFVVFLAAVFSVTINVLVGAQSIEPKYLAVARSFDASERRIIRTIVVPTIVPYLIAGMRLASGRALVGVVVAEFIASNQGIGFMMSVAGTTLSTDRLMLGLLVLGVFGMVLGEGLRRLERRFDAWRPPGAIA